MKEGYYYTLYFVGSWCTIVYEYNFPAMSGKVSRGMDAVFAGMIWPAYWFVRTATVGF